jgi:pyruvate dehydrogenase E1 component alpha subunit
MLDGDWSSDVCSSDLEVETYRYRGHSMSDPAKYRSKEEVESMRDKHDPIETLRALMVREKLLDEEGFKLIEREIKDIVADCAEFAQTSPEPDSSELWTDILVEG